MTASQVKRLGEIATVIMGQSPPGDTYNSEGNGLPFFQGKAEFGEESPTPVKWCSKPSRIAEAGDILMSVRAPVGPTNYADQQCCIGRGLAAIRAHEEVVNQRYLGWFLKRFEADLARKGVGSTFSAINRKDIESLDVPVPPLAEQERIVRLLDEADAIRKLRARADQRTADLVPALFHKMFGDPVTNPMGWPTVRFSTVGSARLGKMLDSKKQTGTHSRPYLRNTNVKWNSIDLASVQEMDFSEADRTEFRLEYGDLLICEGGEVGRAAIWRDEMPECYFQKALHRVRVDPETATPEYLLFVLRGIAERNGFRDYVGTATIPHLTGVKLASIRIPLPPIDLQRRFSSLIGSVEKVTDNHNRGEKRLAELTDSLLQVLVA